MMENCLRENLIGNFSFLRLGQISSKLTNGKLVDLVSDLHPRKDKNTCSNPWKRSHYELTLPMWATVSPLESELVNCK